VLSLLLVLLPLRGAFAVQQVVSPPGGESAMASHNMDMTSGHTDSMQHDCMYCHQSSDSGSNDCQNKNCFASQCGVCASLLSAVGYDFFSAAGTPDLSWTANNYRFNTISLLYRPPRA
jgi:hypothetical protein